MAARAWPLDDHRQSTCQITTRYPRRVESHVQPRRLHRAIDPYVPASSPGFYTRPPYFTCAGELGGGAVRHAGSRRRVHMRPQLGYSQIDNQILSPISFPPFLSSLFGPPYEVQRYRTKPDRETPPDPLVQGRRPLSKRLHGDISGPYLRILGSSRELDRPTTGEADPPGCRIHRVIGAWICWPIANNGHQLAITVRLGRETRRHPPPRSGENDPAVVREYLYPTVVVVRMKLVRVPFILVLPSIRKRR